MTTLYALHAVYLLAVALVMGGCAWAAYYAYSAHVLLLHTLAVFD